MKYKAVLFDLWGTLADFQLPELERLGQKAKTIIGDDRWNVIRQAFIAWHKENIDHTEFMQNLNRSITLTEGERRLVEDWISFDGFILFPETIDILDWLKRHDAKLALISNAPQSTKEQFENFGLSKFFDSICFSFELGVMKPEQKIYQHALTQLNVSPKNAVMIGDSFDKDIMGAARLGIEGVLIDRSNQNDGLEAYVTKISNLIELKDILFSE